MSDALEPAAVKPRPRGSMVLRLMLVVGLCLCLWGALDVGMALWAYAWPSTEARIVSRDRQARIAWKRVYYVDVGTYEYEVEGERHEGRAYAYGVKEWIDAPAKGSTRTVRYCPLAPGVAVMEPGLVLDHFLWLIVGGVILVIATAPARLWRRRQEAKVRYVAAKKAARARRG